MMLTHILSWIFQIFLSTYYMLDIGLDTGDKRQFPPWSGSDMHQPMS